MILMGFGFLITFIKTHAWSALSYTFFINAIAIQYYILWSSFWNRVIDGGWPNKQIQISQSTLVAASYSVVAMLIAFGSLLGRVGPLELLVMAMVGIIGYTLNESIVLTAL